MKKKRIRYSELGAAPAQRPSPPVPPEAAPTPAAEAIPAAAPPIAPRPKRNSTPVELARALAAARAQEVAARVEATPEVVPSEPFLRVRERVRARSGVAELLMFRIGSELFAVELLAVDEVIDLPVIHHVPEMPPAMLGVVTVRGSLTPVYTPQAALGIPLARREAVLIFRSGAAHARVGILIDDVEDAISLDLRDMRTAPGADEDDNVVLGVVRHAGALVAIVDAEALIAACRVAAVLEIA